MGDNPSTFCTVSPGSENQPSQSQWPSVRPRLALLAQAFSSRGMRKPESLRDHYFLLSPTSYPHIITSFSDNSKCRCRLTAVRLDAIFSDSSRPLFPGLFSRWQREEIQSS